MGIPLGPVLVGGFAAWVIVRIAPVGAVLGGVSILITSTVSCRKYSFYGLFGNLGLIAAGLYMYTLTTGMPAKC